MKYQWRISLAGLAAVTLAGAALIGCGTAAPTAAMSDGGTSTSIALPTPEIGPAGAPACTDPHSVCMTVQMPATIPGPPTHFGVGYWVEIPIRAPAEAWGTVQSPPLVAGQVFHVKATDGGLSGPLFPAVFLFMPGGGDVIAVDGLDYGAETMESYEFTGAPINVAGVMNLMYGI